MQFSSFNMFTHCMCTQHVPLTHQLRRMFYPDSQARQTKDKKWKYKIFMAEQRPSYFFPARCAYLSHFHFNSSSTRAPPASNDL